jgi:hypothetical protein
VTPVEIRQTFNGAFNRSTGDTRKAMARLVRKALIAHPWLIDQITWSTFDAVVEATPPQGAL